VLHGAFAEQRRYFDVENRTYVVRHQQAWRRSLDASSAGG